MWWVCSSWFSCGKCQHLGRGEPPRSTESYQGQDASFSCLKSNSDAIQISISIKHHSKQTDRHMHCWCQRPSSLRLISWFIVVYYVVIQKKSRLENGADAKRPGVNIQLMQLEFAPKLLCRNDVMNLQPHRVHKTQITSSRPSEMKDMKDSPDKLHLFSPCELVGPSFIMDIF